MSQLLRVDLLGVGLLGPGLVDWTEGQGMLRRPSRWKPAPTVVPLPASLAPAERRRAGTLVKLGIAVADQALAQARGVDTTSLATVFASSSGDGGSGHEVCEALATPERRVSPTRFTNSVHNAAAAYWHIARASSGPSTSLCAHDGSAGAGLLEAASQCVADARLVLLVVSDTPLPEPMAAVRPLPDSFAASLLLAPAAAQGSVAALEIALGEDCATPCGDARLEALRAAIPAARVLPLLEALADVTHGVSTASVAIEYQAGLSLRVQATRPYAPKHCSRSDEVV